MENDPSLHTRKRTSRAPPSTQALSDRRKQQQLRERQRALQAIRTGQDFDGRETQAVIDPWGAENSIPMFEGVTLPRQLVRPSFRMPRPEALAAIDPGLVETNIEYINDCMELRGEQCVFPLFSRFSLIFFFALFFILLLPFSCFLFRFSVFSGYPPPA